MTNQKQIFKFLPLTLSLETLRGIATPLILRGTPLPAKRSQVFSTAADNQKGVTIKAYLGERPIANKNIFITNVELKDIPDAPRGQPEIQVSFEIDQECILSISAVDKKSDQKVVIRGDKNVIGLSKEDIEKHLKETEDNRTEDQMQLNLLESRNKADLLISEAERYMREKQAAGLNEVSWKKWTPKLSTIT